MTTETALPPICVNIARLRKEHDLTLRDVTARTGIAHSYINALEHGTMTNPSLNHLLSLAWLFGVTLDDLVGMDELAGLPAREERP